jgi:1,4-dihydroxy-2-naphthoate octaprenyltransferase
MKGSSNQQQKLSFSTKFVRLTRAQFLPLIVVPISLGTALSFYQRHIFIPAYFIIAVVGSISLHLAANAIDDVYDFESGVDEISETTFPKDFAAWKVLPRKLMSTNQAKAIAYSLFAASFMAAFYFAITVGPWAIILGVAGILLAYFYVAPPLRLDYRGKGLGELSIFLSFGPIPVLGSFYVQTGQLSLVALATSVPLGVLTTTILLNHDMIFYDVYVQGRKFSLTAVIGRRNTAFVSLGPTAFAYAFTIYLAVARVVPAYSLAALIPAVLIVKNLPTYVKKKGAIPPEYVKITGSAMLADILFGVVFTISLLLA